MKTKENSNEVMDPELQDIMNQAEMDAGYEQAEQAREEEEGHTESIEKQEAEAAADAEIDHVLILSREYEFDGKKIDRLDFSKLPDMTTRDMEYADRVLARLNHDPADKFRDTMWAKYIAVRATGYVPDFFDKLCMRDMLGIVGMIRTYFLLGWE